MRSTALFFLVLLLVGCRSSPPLTKVEGTVMTMPYRILVGDPLSPNDEHTLEELVVSTFVEIHQVYNRWNPQSELSRWNRAEAIDPIELSEPLFHFLEETGRWVGKTHGRFDPTVFSLQQAWIHALERGETPDRTEVIGWENVLLEQQTAKKSDPHVQMDLSGIVKGYGVDLLVERMEAKRWHNVYVEWGGEIRVAGRHPSGRPWRVGLVKDQGEVLLLEEGALATSGDTYQKWSVGEEVFSHIVDPQSRSLIPVNAAHPSTVTILAPTCLVADALATAAMTFPTQAEAEAWLDVFKQEGEILEYWVDPSL